MAGAGGLKGQAMRRRERWSVARWLLTGGLLLLLLAAAGAFVPPPDLAVWLVLGLGSLGVTASLLGLASLALRLVREILREQRRRAVLRGQQIALIAQVSPEALAIIHLTSVSGTGAIWLPQGWPGGRELVGHGLARIARSRGGAEYVRLEAHLYGYAFSDNVLRLAGRQFPTEAIVQATAAEERARAWAKAARRAAHLRRTRAALHGDEGR